jgi:Fe-S cluster assembly scaffold protein SufB
VIFMPISEAIREYPDLVRQYMGTVVPVTDNFFATLNSAVFTDGSFVYIPPGVRCPMELSTYFRINEKNTGQFERTLIIADKGSYVSYLEGCTAPKRDENQLHAAVVELIALDDAEIKYSTVQNWYPGTRKGGAASTTSSPSAAIAGAGTRSSPGPRWRPARRSPGSTRPASCAATIPAGSSTPSPCRTACSRWIPAPR